LVVATNKTIGSEERITESNAPKNDANYQWDLTSGAGGGSMAADPNWWWGVDTAERSDGCWWGPLTGGGILHLVWQRRLLP